MRIPASQLREWVALPTDATPEHLHEALVSVGFEEEDVHPNEISGPIVVGEVLEFTPEPQDNGKTIRWCQVRVATSGDDAVRGIVCGAANFEVGDKVVVTLPGSVLPGPFPIAARKTYGHVSDGMIASAKELGLGEEHDGILRLSEMGLDPEVGTDAIELLGLSDFAVEINVTPDRGYAMSMRGVAREYAHATGVSFNDPAAAVTVTPGVGFKLAIQDNAPIRGAVGCTGFVTRVVRGLDRSKRTPAWMIKRLALMGIRSISLPVDISNYVMMELGQPTHTYDLNKLTGGITVRRATKGEKLTTLDEQVRVLSEEDLLITDESGPIGLAGVMGGATTEIDDASTDVLIEAATFDPVTIARTARRHKLPSEASKRFARGVDPLVSRAAAQRVVDLLVELGGGTADALGTDLVEFVPRAAIHLPADFTAKLIGVEYSAAEIETVLTDIGATTAKAKDGWTVTPPSWRPDLVDAPGLAEEVARIHGYDRIPSAIPVAPPGRGLSRSQAARRRVAQVLAGAGLTEVLAYPFVTTEHNALFGSVDGTAVPEMTLANALDPNVAQLRRSLLPGILDIAKRNVARGLTSLAIYELGSVFQPVGTTGSTSIPIGNVRPDVATLDGLYDSVPAQPWHVSAVFVGPVTTKQPGQIAVPSGLGEVLDAVQAVATAVGVDVEIRQGSHQAFHPGRCAEVFVGDVSVGFAGEVLPSVALSLDLPRVVSALDLDLDVLIAAAPDHVVATPVLVFPAATQDVSLVVDQSVPAADVRVAIVDGAGELLESAHLVDDYRGAGLDENQKSLTFALRFRAPDRTLTQQDATDAKLAGVAVAASRHNATIRE
ncbi:MAG: phenylalanine--tRNA ligase subunit beta [Microbacteriaceae bacterium]|nr:phenylalanine--tRNA ligase subunit beta [Microbacteriaceae bacterium]